MHLQCAHGRNDDDGVGNQARIPALDIQEFFHPDVRAKAGFRHDVIAKFQRDLVSHNRRVAVRDVRKWTGVHERGRAFECLHQVGEQGVFHQNRHRAGNTQVFGGNRFAFGVRADDDAAEAFAHIFDARRQRENRHHFRSNRNIVPGDALVAFFFITQTNLNFAEQAVVNIDDAHPRDRCRVNVEPEQTAFVFRVQVGKFVRFDAKALGAFLNRRRERAIGAKCLCQFIVIGDCAFVQHARIDGGGKQVVCGADGVNVAGQMEIEIFHRHDLRITAAGGATFDSKCRTHRGLANAGDDVLFQMRTERLRETNRRGRFTFAEGSWRDCSNVDVLTLLAFLEAIAHFEVNFGFVGTVQFEFFCFETDFFRNLKNRFHLARLRDFNVAWYWVFDLDCHLWLSPPVHLCK